MFKRLGRQSENKEERRGQLEEEKEISISPMFKWLKKQSRKTGAKTRLLWGREFKAVQKGLDEEQVVSFVNDLIAEQKASREASASALRSLLAKAVTDAEQIAASIKMKAQKEAETEATTIISQAEQEAQEVKRSAERAAQKEAEDILSVANRKAEITEVEAKHKALLFLVRAREDIEKEIGDEYKRVHSRLFSSLQGLMSEGQDIEAELRSKRAQLWESKTFELKQYEAGLLGTSQVEALEEKVEESVQLQREAPREKIEEPVQLQEEAPGEKVEEPVQLQEEAPGEKVEEPVQLQEEALEEKVEEPVQLQEEALEKKVEEPVQLQEEAPEEKVEEPVQLQEEALEKKVEEPVQLQEEVIVSEPVGKATEESLEQYLPEQRPGRGEDESAPLELDSQAPYTGEVEVEIATPADLQMVYKLYDHLQTIPELRILHTRGSWDRGTVIAVVLDKPIPLVSLLSEMAGVEVTQSLPQISSLVEGVSSSLLGTKRKGTKRIQLTLKE
ncbi:hypothetical protein ACFLUU_01660 [Chloroflexota bacterium]